MFRLLLILKLQLLPIIFLLVKFSRWSESEEPFILINDLVWIFWILAIILIPIILKIRWKFSFLWMVANYIFFLIGFYFLTVAIFYFEGNLMLWKKLSYHPAQELLWYQAQRNLDREEIRDDFFLLVFNEEHPEKSRAQFVSQGLYVKYLEARLDDMGNQISIINSIVEEEVPDTAIPSLLQGIKSDSQILSKKMVDSFREDFNEKFYYEVQLLSQIKDSMRFKSNQEYYQRLESYLKVYERTFTDTNYISKVIVDGDAESYVRIGEGHLALLYPVSPNLYLKEKENLLQIEDYVERRELRAAFIPDRLFAPLRLIAKIKW